MATKPVIEQAEANQAEFMAQQQRLSSNCACRLPVAFDSTTTTTTPFMGSLALFDPDATTENGQTTIFGTHGHGDGSPFVGTPASGGPNILDFRPGRLFPLTGRLGAADMSSSPTPIANEQAGLSLFPADIDSNTASTIPDTAELDPSHLPSFRNLQEWMNPVTQAGPRNHDNDIVIEDDNYSDQDIERLLQAFAALECATVSAQHDIMGVADTTAICAGYFRRSILERKQNVEGLVKFLETVEHRMCEISRIAAQQVLGQARRSREAVEACAVYRDRVGHVQEGEWNFA